MKTLLLPRLSFKWIYLIGIPLYGQENVRQLKKHPNRPLWIVALIALIKKLFHLFK